MIFNIEFTMTKWVMFICHWLKIFNKYNKLLLGPEEWGMRSTWSAQADDQSSTHQIQFSLSRGGPR